MEDPSILLLVWLVPSQSTSARSVVNTLPQVLIFPDTNKPTRSWPQKQPSPATSATKCMSQPQLFRCMFSLIIFHTNVMFVAKLSPDPGCYKDTWGVTLGINPTVALIVASLLLTGWNQQKYFCHKYFILLCIQVQSSCSHADPLGFQEFQL